PPFRPDASQPMMPRSRTRTSTPARRSHQAVLSPVTPPPTTTTLAPSVRITGPTGTRPAADPASLVPHHAPDGQVVRGDHGIAGPVGRELRGDAEPAHPVLAHLRRL